MNKELMIDKPQNRLISHPWLAVSAIGLSTFSVVTTEMLPIGLLSPIAETLNTTAGHASLMISLPALLAALFSPLILLVSGRINRRTLLCVLMLLLIGANLASAAASNISWLLAARVLVGLCIGGIWAIAGGLASRLVAKQSIGLATAIIFGGVAAASVFGIPLGALIGDLLGWRAAFLVMTIFTTLVLILLIKSLPSLPADGAVRVRQFIDQLANRQVIIGLLLTLFLVAGHFMAFTFIRPLLQVVAHYESHWIGPLLFAYGCAGIIGNFLAGSTTDKQIKRLLVLITLGLILSILLFSLAGISLLASISITLLWGLSYGGVSVSLMRLMMLIAPKAIEVVTSLYIGMFNLAIAIGAFCGGQLVDLYGLNINLLIAGVTLLIALLIIASLASGVGHKNAK